MHALQSQGPQKLEQIAELPQGTGKPSEEAIAAMRNIFKYSYGLTSVVGVLHWFFSAQYCEKVGFLYSCIGKVLQRELLRESSFWSGFFYGVGLLRCYHTQLAF